MKVNKITIEGVFDRTERLEAPLFQRPYVWVQDKNWEPLWEAIQTIADKQLKGLPTRPHFLGTIVLEQIPTPTAAMNVRQIIDGQQRLTTLQLIIAAARDLCTKTNEELYAQAFKKLLINDFPLSKNPDDIFKVWPTNADREDFRNVIKAESAALVRKMEHAHPDDNWLIPDAYLYFYNTFDEWLGPFGTDEFKTKLKMLYATIKDFLLLVVIDLENDDDAQEIFETLNALGTPLLPADLVKNYLFRIAVFQGEDRHQLYQQYWEKFDKERSYWRKKIRQGRFNRPRLDLFLFHYLTLMTGAEIIISQLFPEYRNFVEQNNGNNAIKQMELFHSYANVYQSFDQFSEKSREGIFFYRLAQLDTSTVFPLLLEVVKRYNTQDTKDELIQIIEDLESFLVRRVVCALTPKNYNKLFVELIKELKKKDDFSASAIRQFLRDQTSDIGRWPNDEEFKKSWLEIQFYKQLKRARGRMILEALETALYTGKTEEIQIERRLTIEHLLPKEWEPHWPLQCVNDVIEANKMKERRNQLLHTIGNLTLLTKELNPSVSNGPWERKRKDILKHSALNLNRTLPEVWDEKTIQDRAQDLFEIAVKIWPYPKH